MSAAFSDHDLALLARCLREGAWETLPDLIETLDGWGEETFGGTRWGIWLAVRNAAGEQFHMDHHPGYWSRKLDRELVTPCRAALRDGASCTVFQDGADFRTVVEVRWEPGENPAGVSLWLTLPCSTRSEQQQVLVATLRSALQAVAERSQLRLIRLPIETLYTRDRFERNVETVTEHLLEHLLLVPRMTAGLLRLLAVQLDAYLGETFGEAAEEALLADLRAMREEGRNPGAFPRAQRTVRIFARLLHLRSVLLPSKILGELPLEIQDILPPLLGDLLDERGRDWSATLGELLLVHWIGASEALREGLACRLFAEELGKLGWNVPENPGGLPADEIFRTLAGAAARRYGAAPAGDVTEAGRAELSFWKGPEQDRAGTAPASPVAGDTPKDAVEEEHWRLERLFARWLVLHRLLDLEILELRRETFSTESRLRLILEELWPMTREAVFGWLLLHKQWSTPSGVDLSEGSVRRKEILDGLERFRPKDDGQPLDQVARLELEKDGLVLHVDPLWTNLYLVHRLLRHLGPSPPDGTADATAWEGLLREQPTPPGQGNLLLHLSRMLVFLLWQLLQHEEHPERYAIVPPAGAPAGRGEESTGGNGEEPPPFYHPIGPERYAESLIRLMDAFGHAVLHVERAVDIAGYLRRVVESELLMHAVSDYYRDHLYHLVDLAMLGDFLLTARTGRRTGFMWNLLVPPARLRPGGDGYRLDVLRRQWFVAAVFHDVGYLFSLMARVPEFLKEQGSRSHREFVAAIEAAFRGEIEALELRIDELTRHLADRKVGLDRGVHSAVMLRDHLEEAMRPGRKGETRGLLQAYEPSLRAICQHNLQEEEVSQEHDPLSFLMVLCDELTDWGRNRVRAAELRRFTVFQTVLDANWQERRVPVLTELLVHTAGLEGGSFVVDTPEAGIGQGAQPFTRRKRVRLDILQVYHQDEVGYLNPVYLWVMRARNLERLAVARAGHRELDIRIFTMTGVPYRLRKAETVHAALLEEIAVRWPELALGELVRELAETFLDTLRQGSGGTTERPFVAQAIERVREEIDARVHAKSRTVELQVFSIDRLNRRQPLQGFSPVEQLEALAKAFQLVLGEREEQRRLRGLRALRSKMFL